MYSATDDPRWLPNVSPWIFMTGYNGVGSFVWTNGTSRSAAMKQDQRPRRQALFQIAKVRASSLLPFSVSFSILISILGFGVSSWNIIASVSRDNAYTVMSMSIARCTCWFSGHSRRVNYLAISPISLRYRHELRQFITLWFSAVYVYIYDDAFCCDR